jgi:hypothetical protein
VQVIIKGTRFMQLPCMEFGSTNSLYKLLKYKVEGHCVVLNSVGSCIKGLI